MTNVEPIKPRTSNLSRIEELLDDPKSESSLETLKQEMNELAALRHNSRVAFCKRLALAWMVIVGQRPVVGPLTMEIKKEYKENSHKFYTWCFKNLKTANGHHYSSGTIRTYLTTGFSNNPEKTIRDAYRASKRSDEKTRKLGAAVRKAVNLENQPQAVPIYRIKTKFKTTPDVAREVNILMRAWEDASTESRSLFIYQVTGRKL